MTFLPVLKRTNANRNSNKAQPLQEPHPVRLLPEEVEKRKAQLDSSPLSMFEHLSDLKSFFVEVGLKKKKKKLNTVSINTFIAVSLNTRNNTHF